MAESAAEAAARVIAERLERAAGRLCIAGLCGAQGSGKSTLAAELAAHFNGAGVATAVLSIDDLYLGHADRLALGEAVHPLLATRGVPGTHDIALGLAVIEALRIGRPTPMPRFDKGRDDRCPADAWEMVPEGLGLLIFEGWCVGARAQAAADLDTPVNDLERDCDADGRWRHFVNAALDTDYQRLFAAIDVQILLAAPGFGVVQAWRTQQEHERRAAAGPSPRDMSDAQIARFIQHYQRLTEHILTEMPARADLTVWIDSDRRPVRTAGLS